MAIEIHFLNKAYLFLVFVCTLFLIHACSAQSCPHQQGGLVLFSSLANWNKYNATLTITQPTLFDKSPGVKLFAIVINSPGSLIFNDTTLNVDLDYIKVNSGGKLIAGSRSCPIINKITITFYGARTNANIIGSDVDGAPSGYKGLVALSQSYVQMHGKVDGPTWTDLAETALKDSTIIKVRDPCSWKVGDKLVIASTDYGEILDKAQVKLPVWRVGVPFPDQNEERTIVQVIDSSTFILDTKLSYNHWGSGVQRAEIGKLNRNIVLQGDSSSDSSLFGGHVMIRLVEQFEMVGVEIRKMGQKGLMGRYALHFHMIGDYGETKNYLVQHNSIHNTFQRCIVVHGTNYVNVDNNLCFDITGHAFFLEDGAEIFNKFTHNLGIRVKPVLNADDQQLIPSDNEVAVFWITNPHNTWIENHAVGGKFGFWFSLPASPIGLSAGSPLTPRTLPLLGFQNNVVHSANHVGLHIDDFLRSDGGLENATYTPRDDNNLPVKTYIEGLVAYKNRKYGAWTKVEHIVFINSSLIDNRVAFNSPGNPSLVIDSVFDGESENVGQAIRTNVDVGGRSRPGFFDYMEEIRGYEFYDNDTPNYLKGITFTNFKTDIYRSAGAIGQLSNSNFKYETSARLSQLTFENCNNFYFLEEKTDGNRGLVVLDTDGTSTGRTFGGGYAVANNTFMTFKGCTENQNWKGFNCPLFQENYAQLTVINLDNQFETTGPNGETNTDIMQLKAKKITRMFVHDMSTSKVDEVHGYTLSDRGFWMDSNVILKNVYALRWVLNIATPPNLNVYLRSFANNDWAIVSLQYPSDATLNVTYTTVTSPTPQPVPRVSSIQELINNPTSYYYDTASLSLFLHFKNVGGRMAYKEYYGEYTEYVGYSTTFNIKANCPSGKCEVSNWDLPVSVFNTIKLLTMEERFTGILQSCQAGIVGGSGSGTVFASLLPDKKTVDFVVYHDLGALATGLQVGVGNVGETVRILNESGVIHSPYSMARFSFDFSYDEIISLLKGQVFVKVLSTQYPEGHLRAQVYCNNGITQFGNQRCSLPLPISTDLPCNAIDSHDQFSFYSELADSAGWNALTIPKNGDRTTAAKDYSTSPICGSTSLLFGVTRGKVQLAKSYTKGVTTPQWIDLSVFKYFEFFIKSLTPGQLSLNIYFTEVRDTTLTDLPMVFIDKKYIQHFKIDDTRVTRVRIPISNLGFTNQTSLNAIQRVGFSQKTLKYDYMYTYKEFVIDSMRFITENRASQDTFTTTPPLLPTEIVGLQQVCDNLPVSDPDPDPLTNRVFEDPYCADACSGRGVCVKPFTCQCNEGWTGDSCNVPVCSPTCSAHGQCIAPNTCQCDEGWYDSTCSSQYVCFGYVASDPAVCTSHGKCTTNDKCSCYDGWRGQKCATKCTYEDSQTKGCVYVP